MSEHQIRFTGEMVRAILDGRKTQIRRLIKPQPKEDYWKIRQLDNGKYLFYQDSYIPNGTYEYPFLCHVGQIGDRLLASRITLEITDIRVERVKDIELEDIRHEGLVFSPECDGSIMRTQFKNLWDSIYEKKGSGWDENPWVWVIEFKQINANNAPDNPR